MRANETVVKIEIIAYRKVYHSQAILRAGC